MLFVDEIEDLFVGLECEGSVLILEFEVSFELIEGLRDFLFQRGCDDFLLRGLIERV